jgi:hypothetical protein
VSRPRPGLRIAAALLLGAGALLAGAAHAADAAGGWEADRRLTVDPGPSLTTYNFARSVAAGPDGRVEVVWYDDRGAGPQVYTRRSLDHGATWETERLLSAGFERAEHPAVAASGATVLAVWHGQEAGEPGLDVHLRRSTDGGQSWGAVAALTASHAAAHAAVAIDGATAAVVWGDARSGLTEIFTRLSTDGGSTWGAERPVSGGAPTASWVPTVEVAGAAVQVAWVDTQDGNEEEYIRRSTDAGRTWEPARRLTRNGANSWAPSLALAGSTVHLAWFDQSASPVQPDGAEAELDGLLRALGLPVRPEPPGVLVPDPEEEARRRAGEKAQRIEAAIPAFLAAGGDAAALHSILEQVEALGAAGAPYLAKERKLDQALALLGLAYPPHPFPDVPLVDHGTALLLRVADKLTQVSEAAPAFVAHGGDPFALSAALQAFERHLQSALHEWEIFTRRSDDGGRTWGPAQRLTHAPGLSQRPSIAAEGDCVAVLWFDDRDGNLEIYAKESLDGGRTWSADQRLTRAPGDSRHVSVAMAGGELYAVWYDERDGNPEIYFKHRPRQGRAGRTGSTLGASETFK